MVKFEIFFTIIHQYIILMGAQVDFWKCPSFDKIFDIFNLIENKCLFTVIFEWYAKTWQNKHPSYLISREAEFMFDWMLGCHVAFYLCELSLLISFEQAMLFNV
jgi:hypothetical protein